MALHRKRAYEEPEPHDGYRVLVDRLWPRGLSKEQLRVDAWLKELAPSTELRRWFGHEPARWEEFRRRYLEELAAPERQALLADLAERSRSGNVTLVFAAREERYSNAAVIKEAIEQFQAGNT